MSKARPQLRFSLDNMVSNVSFTMMRSIVNIPIEFLNAVLIARWLGPAQNGQYNMAMLLASLLALALSMSLSTSNVYFISKGDVSARTALQTSLMIWLLFSLIGGVSVSIAVLYSDIWFPGISKALLWGAWPVFVMTLLQGMLMSFLQALQRFKAYNSIGILSSLSRLFFIVTAHLIFGLTPWLALLGYVGMLSVVSITLIYLLLPFPRSEDEGGLTFSGYFFKCLFYGAQAHASNILAFVNDRMDTYLVNFLMGTAHTGYFTVASTLTQRLWIVSEAVNLIVFPVMASLEADSEYRASFTAAVARLSFICTCMVGVVFALLIYPLLRYVFGLSYLPAVYPVWWLIPGIVLASMGKVFANELAAIGKPYLNLYIAIGALFFNLGFNYLLIPIYQASGAAMATSLSWLLMTLAWIVIFLKLNKKSLLSLLLPGQIDREIISIVLRKVKK